MDNLVTDNVAHGLRGIHLLPSEELQELPDVYVHLSHLLWVSILRGVFRGYKDMNSSGRDREAGAA